MTGENPELFGQDFPARIRAGVPSGVDDSRVHVCPSGLVVIVGEKRDGVAPLGCPLCLGRQLGQDEMGDPTVSGVRMVQPEHAPGVPTTLAANLWLCPQCQSPARALLPRFTP